MEKHYCFAGVEVTIRIPDAQMYDNDRHLEAFRTESVTDPHYFVLEAADILLPPQGELIATPPSMRIYRWDEEEIKYWGNVETSLEYAYLRVQSRGKHHRVQYLRSKFPEKVMVKTILNCLGTEHLIARTGGFIFHCSYIEHHGKAILFTAPSGTGKSTQADLWHQYRGAEIINGDRAAVRLVNGAVFAEGIPYAGSSPYCRNRSLPIQAIVYLGQAQETTVRKLRGYEAFCRIWEGISVNTWDKTDMELVSEAVQAAAGQVPVFYMPCTPDENAVKALEEALRKLDSL